MPVRISPSAGRPCHSETEVEIRHGPLPIGPVIFSYGIVCFERSGRFGARHSVADVSSDRTDVPDLRSPHLIHGVPERTEDIVR
jgi:hypothetical protein